ncbi:sugar transport protein [Pseudonocardia hierapolitana]|uniref:Sugar transport protein n=1 Tax=Pseudonocardia hierapolitana TaxID=1128676 RepID=A0A561SLG7_9PSEU|nr:sugar transport protein [Pseudonocardia hierapolitana]
MSRPPSGFTSPTKLRKVIAASMAGTVAEWYEFLLYSAASALVFGALFFPDTDNPLDGVINALLIYAVGFVARPLGGMVFGYFGDRYGRKKLLQVSLLLVGVATFLIGCLPGFDTIGYGAPVLLVLLRFVQGFAVGGEWGGAVLLVGEHSPAERRAFWSSWPQAGLPVGNLLATIALLSLAFTLPEDAFLAWGWRVAFWASAVIVLIGYYIRTQVEEAPIFLQAVEKAKAQAVENAGVFEVVRRYPRGILVAMGARVAENILYQVVVTFSITYLSIKVGSSTTDILLLLVVAHVIHFAIVLLFGHLADRIGRRPVFLAGSVLMCGWGFVGFPLMDTGSDVLIVVALVLGVFVHALMYAPQPAMMAEMFPTRMRYSGVSFGYQMTSIFAGSLAPFITASLLRAYDSSVPIALYLLVAAVISTVAVAFARETKGISLESVDLADDAREPAGVPAH